jgi:hypothetical protein
MNCPLGRLPRSSEGVLCKTEYLRRRSNFRCDDDNAIYRANIPEALFDPVYFGQVTSARDPRIIQLGLKLPSRNAFDRGTKGRDSERLKNRMPETRIFACSRQRILPFLYGTMAVTSLECPLS